MIKCKLYKLFKYKIPFQKLFKTKSGSLSSAGISSANCMIYETSQLQC